MKEKKKREMKSTARRVFLDPSTPPVTSVLRVVIIVLLILSVWDFAKGILSSLTFLFFMIVLAIFFAYLIEPVVRVIQAPFEARQRERLMPRPLAIAAAYVIIFSVLGISIASLAPRVSEQARQLTVNVPAYTNSVQSWFNDLNRRLDRYRIPEQIQERFTGRASNLVDEVGSQVESFLRNFLLHLPWFILVPILGFFFLKDANFFRISFLRLFPSGRWRARIESVIQDVNQTLAAYVRAQLISCLLIGTICTIGFYVIGINYALLLGIVAGILEFIPLLGPLTIALIAVVFALLQSPWMAVYTVAFLGGLRIFHDYFSYPRIVRGGIHLHPLAIILSILAGEQVAGIAGVFISIPVVALLTVIYRHVLEHSGSKGFLADLFEEKEIKTEIKEAVEDNIEIQKEVEAEKT